MKKFRLLFCTAILLFFVNNMAFSQISSRKIDKLVNSVMKKFQVVGAQVAVVKDGKIVHNKGYGFTSINSKEKVNINTRFAIASNSKAFTASALAILVDKGKLNWNDKVIDYIPEFKMYNPYVTAEFTITDLLTHRSGLGLGAGDLMFFPDGGDYKISDILKSFQYQTPTSSFRTKYDYDNLLYVVAGEVVKRITGMSWSEYVEKNIMQVLAMNESAGKYARLKNKTNVAFPHATINNKNIELKPFDIGVGAAAGGIYSSTSDLCKWVIMHMNDGKVGKKELISKKNHNILWKPHTNIWFNVKPHAPRKTHFAGYGLGFGIRDINGKILISHTGGLPGMLSKISMIPELNLGVIVLTNTDNGGAGVFTTVSQKILDSYLKIKDSDYIEKYYKRFKKRELQGDSVTTKVWQIVKNSEKNKPELEGYLGTYKDDWFGKVKIFINNGKMWLKSERSPKLNGQMFYYKANTFVVKWEYQDMNADAFASFNLNEEGDAVSIKMKGISPNIDFSFDFQDLELKKCMVN